MDSRRSGFTLIELLIVVLIISILAGVAAARLNEARRMTYYSVLRADLKNLQLSQSLYHAVNGRYTSDPAQLDDFQPSTRVTLSAITLSGGANDDQGWSASATHSTLGAASGCVMFDGAISGPVNGAGATAEVPGLAGCAE